MPKVIHPSEPGQDSQEPEELSVTPTELEIVKGESATAEISGGSGTYTAETTTANIDAEVEGSIVTITTNAQSAASDTVTISDGTDEVTIAVTTKDE